MFRNVPREGFRAHCFNEATVRDAYGPRTDDDELASTLADMPVKPLCRRTTSHGPFERVTLSDAEAGATILTGESSDDAGVVPMCNSCVTAWKRADETQTEVGSPSVDEDGGDGGENDGR